MITWPSSFSKNHFDRKPSVNLVNRGTYLIIIPRNDVAWTSREDNYSILAAYFFMISG